MPFIHDDDHHQKKRLIICCDGTWQSSDKPEGNVSSNVTHMCRALAKEAIVPGGREQQVVYYQSGVGTDVFSSVSASYSGGSGAGLAENVVEAYNFLCLNYQCGDSIYVFGFSRGAYTARALAGMVCKLGILKKAYMDQFPLIYKHYQLKNEGRKSLEEELRKLVREHEEPIHEAYGEYTQSLKGLCRADDHFHHDLDVEIEVVGVWDTVGSLGVPDTNMLGDIGDTFREWANGDLKFHETGISDRIANAFHALALDDHRAPFSPSLWHKRKPCKDNCKEKHCDPSFCKEGCEESHPHPKGKTNLIQCWFPGCHINVGGGSDSDNGDKGQLSDLAFAWMVDLCRPSLEFDDNYLEKFAKTHKANADSVRQEALKRPSALKNDITSIPVWADPEAAPIIDSFESMPTGGSRTRFPGEYNENNTEVTVDSKEWKSKYTTHVTNEFIHPSVRVRLQNTLHYWKGNKDNGYVNAWSSPVQQLALRHFRINKLDKVPNYKNYPGRDETSKTTEGSGLVWYKLSEEARKYAIKGQEVPANAVPLIISEWKIGSTDVASFEKRLLKDYPDTMQRMENPTRYPINDSESNVLPEDLPFGQDWDWFTGNVIGASQIAYKATRNAGYSIGKGTIDAGKKVGNGAWRSVRAIGVKMRLVQA